MVLLPPVPSIRFERTTTYEREAGCLVVPVLVSEACSKRGLPWSKRKRHAMTQLEPSGSQVKQYRFWVRPHLLLKVLSYHILPVDLGAAR